MTRQAIGEGAEFVIWPESSTPFLLRGRSAAAGADAHAGAAGAGADPVWQRSDRARRDGAPTTFYNSAFLVRPDGTTGGVYRKMHLVPFGEYVPVKRLLFFAAPLVRGGVRLLRRRRGGAAAGGRSSVSTAICYEVVYPDLVRRFVVGGSELLTTITNDAWFGRRRRRISISSRPRCARSRKGRYLVRSANTGISGIVDPYGPRARRGPASSSRRCSSARRGSCGRRRSTARIGDVVAYASTVRHALAAAAASAAATPAACKIRRMATVDELMRRYEDLSKRAADLRSYL